MIVMVMGLPGSGKSYLASRLAESLSAIYVNSDRLRKELFPERTYSDLEKTKVYQEMLTKMEEALQHGKNMVLDATFHQHKTRKPFLERARTDICVIEVWAEERNIKERLGKSRPFSEADSDVYQLLKKQWEPLRMPHLRLESTNDNGDQIVQKALQYIQSDKRRN